jgi:hypothetical protein
VGWLVFGVSGLALLVVTMVALRRSLAIHVAREDFESGVHALMKMKKDGGTMTLAQVGQQGVLVRFERSNGLEDQCDLFIDVPRTRWSERNLAKLREMFEQSGLEHFQPPDRPNVLMRTQLRCSDIWDEASGAAGARIAQHIFDACGVDRGARFKVSTTGENSARVWRGLATQWKDGSNTIGRSVGTKLIDQIEAEKQDASKRQE